jgi:predicted cupin superfamily sugar epimerase
MPSAEELIRHLGLAPHPKEGGFFRETYRAGDTLPAPALPPRYQGPRSASTAIYYLLTPTTFSALHRLQTDEIFHFYLGDPIRMLQLECEGTGRTIVLGQDVLHGQQLQVLAPRGIWQGSFLEPDGAFALLGCTVAPGFEYIDYEAGDRHTLRTQYPAFAELIQRLTPP